MDADKFIKLLATTDGRDKIYKVLANVSKIVGWVNEADKVSAKKWNALSKSIGEGRSLMRMAKWVGNVQKLQGYAAKAGSLTSRQFLEILRVIGDFGYILGDNLAYLSKYGILPLNAENAAKQSKIFQFWGYIMATILDALSLSGLAAKQAKMDAAAFAAEQQALVLSFVKNAADTLATLASVGYMKSMYNPSIGFTSLCGATSGAIATYQNWTKLK